jgi:hypothetical protein
MAQPKAGARRRRGARQPQASRRRAQRKRRPSGETELFNSPACSLRSPCRWRGAGGPLAAGGDKGARAASAEVVGETLLVGP